jgi:hypothetical protein
VDAGGLVDAGGFAVGGALSLEMFGEGIDGSLAGACEVAAGISVRVVEDDARIGGFDLVLLARLFDELFALPVVSCSGCAAGAVFSPGLATTMGAGGAMTQPDSESMTPREAPCPDMAWSYTNARNHAHHDRTESDPEVIHWILLIESWGWDGGARASCARGAVSDDAYRRASLLRRSVIVSHREARLRAFAAAIVSLRRRLRACRRGSAKPWPSESWR